MKQFLLQVLQSNSGKSSSRLINLLGFVAMTIWISYSVYTSGLQYEIVAVYAAYCAGGYLGGKYIGKGKDDGSSE